MISARSHIEDYITKYDEDDIIGIEFDDARFESDTIAVLREKGVNLPHEKMLDVAKKKRESFMNMYFNIHICICIYMYIILINMEQVQKNVYYRKLE